jgi:Uma2 family endonuclease
MIETVSPPVSEKVPAEKVPDVLVYEEMDGKPIYYRGYREVLAHQKNPEGIMGCSDVQGIIISMMLRFLFRELPEDQYEIITNEIGLHLERGSNLSSDIVIYQKADLLRTPLKNQYFDIPPLVAIEVDIKADTSDLNTPADYCHGKTEKLFAFGVKQVVWLFSASRKVMVAHPQQDWITKDWDKPVTLLDQYSFSMADLIKKGGIELPS